MTRVTFGVTSSPFLATASLRQAGLDYTDEHFTAKLIPETFYVDDFIYGADTNEATFAIFSDLSELLSKRCFNLRKWWSNDKELLCQIPEELHETEPLCLEPAPQGCPKTLGLHWDTHTDNLHVSTPAPVDQLLAVPPPLAIYLYPLGIQSPSHPVSRALQLRRQVQGRTE